MKKKQLYIVGTQLGLDKKTIDTFINKPQKQKNNKYNDLQEPCNSYKAGTHYGTIRPEDI